MTIESKPAAATVIHEDQPLQFERAIADSNALWLDPAELKRLAGWALKPEGICRGDLCVPIPPGRESEFTAKRDGATFLNFSALADQMGKPWAGDLSIASGISAQRQLSAATRCERWKLPISNCQISTASCIVCRIIAARKFFYWHGPPGEDAPLTCPGGRRCTTNSGS